MNPAIIPFLAALGCYPSPNTLVTVDPTAPLVGFAIDGHIIVRELDESVMVHELWHVCQWQKAGRAWSDKEFARREAEARRVQLLWEDKE